MKPSDYVQHSGIDLFVNWKAGEGPSVEIFPTKPGIYAEIYWPQFGVRIGETGNSLRGKIRMDIRWFKSMYNGTARPHDIRRTLPIAEAAKATGPNGFEWYVVSADPRLEDKLLRQDCERFMFGWVRNSTGLVCWNRQISWH